MNEEFNIEDGFGTLVFCIDDSKWRGSDEWESECLASTGRDLFSFKAGQLWIHNQPGVRNQFYDQPVVSRMGIASSPELGKVKTFQTNSVESNMAPTSATFRTELPTEQKSALPGARFQQREGVYYADILRAYPKLLNGDRIRGPFMFALYEFDTRDHLKLRFINIGYRHSAGHEFI